MFFLNLVLAFVFASVNAQENIENFSSDIRIHVDGSMQVHETITVHATGDQIKRGIVREFLPPIAIGMAITMSLALPLIQ